MFQNKELIKKVFKIFFFGTLDAIVIWSAITLYTQHSYKFLAILLIGTFLLNYTYLSNKHYPLKYILPGTLFMLFLVVYPIMYTVYVSLTNYGTGHILSKDQVIDQLENRYYLAQEAADYQFTVFKDEGNEDLIVVLSAPDGTLLINEENKAIPLRDSSYEAIDSDNDGKIDKLDNLEPLSKMDIFKNLSYLQKLELKYNDKIIKMKTASTFTEYHKQYIYLPERDVIYDIKNNVYYTPVEGYFTAPDGQILEPGFRAYISFNNFIKLLMDERVSKPFLRVFIWTFEWAFLSVLTTFGLGLLLAILLNDKYLKFRGIYRVLLIIPYSIPAFISAMVWRGLLDETVGVVNKVLEAMIGFGPHWITDPLWAKAALIILNLWLGFPYMMLICLGALQSIPEENYEAAAIDGASTWQQFRYITLPMLLVSVTPLLIASFAYNFNNFSVIYLFNRGRPAMVGAQTPAGSTDILISYTYRLSFESGRGADFGLASAVTLIIFIITAFITWFNFRYTGALEELKENV